VSGGSHNYLCHVWDVEDLARKHASLEGMEGRLRDLGYETLARRTRGVRSKLQEALHLAQALTHAWHAVEWYDSGDYSLQSCVEEIEKHHPAQGERKGAT